MTNKDLYVLVTGDRKWQSAKAVGAVLRALPTEHALTHDRVHVLHGEAAGADRIAGAIASRLMMQVEGYPALWDQYGRAAGPIRNSSMLAKLILARSSGHECRVIAFHNDLSQSKGTAHMVKVAKRAGFRVTQVRTKVPS